MKRSSQKQRERGQAVLVAVLFFVVGSVLVLTSVTGPLLRQTRTLGDWIASRQSFYAGEGGVEEVSYRIKNSLAYDASETETLGSASATVTTSTVSGQLQVVGSGSESSLYRKTTALLQSGVTASTGYSVQTDVGGFQFQNGVTTTGNIYTNGPINLTFASPNNTSIIGNVISAGSSGLVNGANITGNVYAHTIQNSNITGDAYYQSISGTTVSGTSHPGSTDQPLLASLPMSDTSVSNLESSAASGGTISSPCPYIITTTQTLGPTKITCDLQIKGGTVTLLGNVWVTGTITISQTPSPTIQIDSSLSGKSLALIADNPSNNSTSGTVTAQNTSIFSAPSGSFLWLISMNTSASNGGSTVAAKAINNVQGVGGAVPPLFLYAPHGKVQVLNNAKVAGSAGYTVAIQNNAVTTYQSGLSSLVFPASNSFTISSWKETQ